MLIHPQPFRDESLGGYVLRVAQLNRQTSKRIYNLAGLMEGNHPNLDLNPYLIEPGFHDLKGLSNLTKTDIDVLSFMAIPFGYKNHLNVKTTVDELGIHIRKSKICPDCLKENNYIRKIWDFTTITVCPKHRTLLIDNCPLCAAVISYSRPQVHKCTCGYDLRKCTSLELPRNEALISQFIASGLLRGSFEDPCVETFHNLLLKKPVEVIIKTLLFFGRYFDGTYKGELTRSRMRNSELHAALMATFEVFCDWPKNFWAYLKRFQQDPNVIGAKQFGQLYSGLYDAQFEDIHYDFIRESFAEYLAFEWDNGHVGVLTKPAGISARKYVTGETARSVLGTHQKYIKRLIHAGQLKGVVRSTRGRNKTLILVDHNSLRQYSKRLHSALSLEEAAKILGISRRTITKHEFYTLLRPLRGPTVDGTARWYFDRETVLSLIENIIHSIPNTKVHVSSNMHVVGFSTAYKIASRYRPCCLRMFIGDVGRILFPSGRTLGAGLQQFVFDKNDILEVYKKDPATRLSS